MPTVRAGAGVLDGDGGRDLYKWKEPCPVRSNASWLMVIWGDQTTENITFPPKQKIDISVISVISISPAVVMTFKNGTESVSRIIS